MPSPQVLAALARALRLSETERIHLFQLAGQLVPDGRRIHDTAPDSLRRLVDQLSASPAAVYDVRWNLVAWNKMWAAVVGDPLDRPERERNLVWRNFTGLPVRVLRSYHEQAQYDEALVADLRSSFGRYPADSRLAQLIADLREVSPRFCELWQAHRVGVYDQERKTIEHPELGLLQLDCEILTAHRSDLRVAVFTAAPGTESARQLDGLYATSSLQPDMAS